eukprot:maker-scaffold_10-snap-gene-13.2-mRNA-1 protein AED:0.20 eAED:0.20 QI:47/0.66/0.5/1/0/0/4/0/167
MLNRLMKTFGSQGNQRSTGSTPFYDFKLQNLEKTETVMFSKYQNKVCLLQLVSADKKYRAEGLEILGFPCNQFGNQEPGSKEQIRKFVNKYGVEFQMFTKIDVNGSNTNEIWRWMKKEKTGILGEGLIKWNFTKFLVDMHGFVRYRFEPKDSVDSMRPKIEELLNEE